MSRPSSLEDALSRAYAARDAKTPLSIGLLGNAAAVFPQLLAMGAEIDIVTDQTSAHDPLAYLPLEYSMEEWDAARKADPTGFADAARHSMAKHVEAMVGFQKARVRGLRLRQQHPHRGARRRLRGRVRVPRLRARLHPPAVLRGQGPVPLGGALAATRRTSPRPTAPCSSCSPRTSRWRAGSRWPASACTSRACPPASAGSATASATSPGCASTTWSPRARSARRS